MFSCRGEERRGDRGGGDEKKGEGRREREREREEGRGGERAAGLTNESMACFWHSWRLIWSSLRPMVMRRKRMALHTTFGRPLTLKFHFCLHLARIHLDVSRVQREVYQWKVEGIKFAV
jgi:hypothetical protein